MWRIVLSKSLQAFLALFVLAVIVFAASHATGDPRFLLLPADATREDFDRLGEALGLDRPLLTQFSIFLGDTLQGDLGRSVIFRVSVASLLAERLVASIQLAVVAFAISIAVGVPLGMLGAVYRGTAVDRTVKFVSLVGQSAPAFFVGIILVQVFAVQLGLLPSGSNRGASSYVLPAVTLALYGIAAIARLLRSSMLEVLDSEFVKLARAKGLSERRVIWRHVVRNALLPVVSFGGLFFISLLTIAVVVETVFAWPGLGQLTFQAILNRDFPVIQGVVLLAGALAILINALVDLSYAYIDPRIHYDVPQTR